uniref:PH domain-containing protein n=1 Tax=Timema bartmani TaxID=61472 RepID=A0A7R9HYG0_9NEOP|nr:unnamed protein product [Timema bartmani]
MWPVPSRRLRLATRVSVQRLYIASASTLFRDQCGRRLATEKTCVLVELYLVLCLIGLVLKMVQEKDENLIEEVEKQPPLPQLLTYLRQCTGANIFRSTGSVLEGRSGLFYAPQPQANGPTSLVKFNDRLTLVWVSGSERGRELGPKSTSMCIEYDCSMPGDGSTELSGHLDVKLPGGARRRGFTPWKAWKKHWCLVRKTSCGAEVQLGAVTGSTKCVVLPLDATLCRTESRSRQYAFGVFPGGSKCRQPALYLSGSCENESQRWMCNIRFMLRPPRAGNEEDFTVSLIDNAHSRLAKLAGLYGVLRVGMHDVIVCDPSTGEVRVTWEWPQLHQFHLAATSRTEDENKICVLHTSSEFCAGPGQILLFCEQAPQLLHCLLSRGRLHRLVTSPIPSPPVMALRGGRRLSRSENDLRCTWEDVTPRRHLRPLGLVRSHSGSRDSGVRTSTASDDSNTLKGKVVCGLISAGLGLMFSTPGCSEADSESLHEYHHVGLADSEEEQTENTLSTWRRESGVSLASGIYEEIADPTPLTGEVNHYENIPGHRRDVIYETVPPPLPPRKHMNYYTMNSMTDEGIGTDRSSYGSTITIPPALLLRFNRGRCYSESLHSMSPCNISEPGSSSWQGNQYEPDYLPMSPILKVCDSADTEREEQCYIVMASLNST